MTSRKALTFGFAKTHNRGLAPNGTHFVNFQPQCASMRAGFASDYKPSSPHASALRLKVSAIWLAPQRLMNNPGYALIFPGPAIFARLICFFHELRFFKELRRD